MKGRLAWRTSAILSAAVLSLAGRCAPAFASATLSWDPNPADGIQGGAGTWNTSNTSWNSAGSPVTWTNSHNDAALFGGVNSGSVQITAAITASALQVDLAGYIIGASASNKLTLSSGLITANADVIISAALSAPTGLTKAGAGTLTLANSGTIGGSIAINQGTLAFTTDGNLGGASNDILLTGGCLRYNGNTSLVLGSGHAVVVDAIGGEIETPSAGLTLATNGQLSGSGILTKLGPQTLLINSSNTAFLGSLVVAAGTLQLQQASAINGQAIHLSGGNLTLHANEPTDFQSNLTVAADTALDVGQIGPLGVSAQTHALGNASIATGTTLTISSSNHDSLQVRDLTLNGALRLVHSGLFVGGALSGNGAVTFDLGTQPPELLTTGLIFASGASITVSNPLSAVPGGSGPVSGATTGTKVAYTGNWNGGGDGASSAVVLRDGGRFTIAAAAHLNTTTIDRTGMRPFAVIGDGVTSTFELEQAFVADHTAGGTIADGFSALEVRDATLITHNSASLPVVTKLDGFGGLHRAGNTTFSGTSGGRWIVTTADQQYDGGVSINSAAIFQLEKNLTHSGLMNHKFDGSFQMPNAGASLTKQGSGTLALSGDQGYAPGTAMQISAGGVHFDTDPGAGWYPGNYSRGVDGNIESAPAPAGTLALSVGGDQAAATAEFAAPHSRVDSIAIKSKGAVQITGPAQTLLTHSLAIESGGQMVLGSGRLIVDYAAGASPASAIAGYIQDGQIISGFKNGLTVSYSEISDFLHISGNQIGTISGETVDASGLLVSAVRIGDANLDGLVNFADFQRLELGYGLANQGWSRGDFNYDGVVDQADLKLLYDHLDSVGSLSQPIAVPEPHFLPYFWVFSAVFCRYRRYIRNRPSNRQNSPESF